MVVDDEGVERERSHRPADLEAVQTQQHNCLCGAGCHVATQALTQSLGFPIRHRSAHSRVRRQRKIHTNLLKTHAFYASRLVCCSHRSVQDRNDHAERLTAWIIRNGGRNAMDSFNAFWVYFDRTAHSFPFASDAGRPQDRRARHS